jgi:hypothetical protein
MCATEDEEPAGDDRTEGRRQDEPRARSQSPEVALFLTVFGLTLAAILPLGLPWYWTVATLVGTFSVTLASVIRLSPVLRWLTRGLTPRRTVSAKLARPTGPHLTRPEQLPPIPAPPGD